MMVTQSVVDMLFRNEDATKKFELEGDFDTRGTYSFKRPAKGKELVDSSKPTVDLDSPPDDE